MHKFFLSLFIFNHCFADEISVSDKLKASLYKELLSTHRPLTYKQANEILFTKLNQSSEEVCSVYTPQVCAPTNEIPNPKVMNIEHTWPQSNGANGVAKSDLHHLFPVDSPTNSMRSSLPFCDVIESKWDNGQSKRGFNSFKEHCFEPPMQHKGNVARALFYFSIRYQMPIDDNQEIYLRTWHKQDPTDQNEIDRNDKIKSFQNNSNIFIERPELAEQIKNF